MPKDRKAQALKNQGTVPTLVCIHTVWLDTDTVWLEGQLTLSEECAVHATKEGFPAQTKIGKSSGFSRGVSL